MQVGLH